MVLVTLSSVNAIRDNYYYDEYSWRYSDAEYGHIWSFKDCNFLEGESITGAFMYTLDTRNTIMDGDINIRSCGAYSELGKTDIVERSNYNFLYYPNAIEGQPPLIPEGEYSYPFQIYSCFVDCNYNVNGDDGVWDYYIPHCDDVDSSMCIQDNTFQFQMTYDCTYDTGGAKHQLIGCLFEVADNQKKTWEYGSSGIYYDIPSSNYDFYSVLPSVFPSSCANKDSCYKYTYLTFYINETGNYSAGGGNTGIDEINYTEGRIQIENRSSGGGSGTHGGLNTSTPKGSIGNKNEADGSGGDKPIPDNEGVKKQITKDDLSKDVLDREQFILDLTNIAKLGFSFIMIMFYIFEFYVVFWVFTKWIPDVFRKIIDIFRKSGKK